MVSYKQLIMNVFTINMKGTTRRLNLPADIIDEIALRLQLQYIPESEEYGRVCLASDPDVRPEYRETFTDAHLHDYIFYMLYMQDLNADAETAELPYPVDVKQFWVAVQKGSQLRNNQTE